MSPDHKGPQVSIFVPCRFSSTIVGPPDCHRDVLSALPTERAATARSVPGINGAVASKGEGLFRGLNKDSMGGNHVEAIGMFFGCCLEWLKCSAEKYFDS